ncbi:hypothetical protein QZH41_006209 [Actinostola sp. cb2023]|nr:hypothetical protein QZH41_006209 [Actinostola sp. cb2023]
MDSVHYSPVATVEDNDIEPLQPSTRIETANNIDSGPLPPMAATKKAQIFVKMRKYVEFLYAASTVVHSLNGIGDIFTDTNDTGVDAPTEV